MMHVMNCLFMNDENALFLGPRMGFPLGLGGPPSPWEEGNLGYEPTRDLPAGGDLGVGLQLEEAMFPTTIR